MFQVHEIIQQDTATTSTELRQSMGEWPEVGDNGGSIESTQCLVSSNQDYLGY
jgi:hypothetical protein